MSHILGSASLIVGILVLPTGCGSEDGGSESSSGGVWSGVGGAGAALGGSSNATGGVAAAVGGSSADFWPAAYNPAGAPTPADGGYHATETTTAPCMMCHAATGPAVLKLAFGGTVYRADGVTRAANVEIGVKDGTNSYFVYSSSNGLYWAAGPDNIAWAAADIRMRNATGDVPKTAATERNADCDSCHVGAELLIIP